MSALEQSTKPQKKSAQNSQNLGFFILLTFTSVGAVTTFIFLQISSLFIGDINSLSIILGSCAAGVTVGLLNYILVRHYFENRSISLKQFIRELLSLKTTAPQTHKLGNKNQNDIEELIESLTSIATKLDSSIGLVAKESKKLSSEELVVSKNKKSKENTQHQFNSLQKKVYGKEKYVSKVAQDSEKQSILVRELNEDSDKIGYVLNEIQSIAEKTHLFALNAAFDAAQAGVKGKGFAVVADEVRMLAQRTQDTTQDIRLVIEHYQLGKDNKSVSSSSYLDSTDVPLDEAIKPIEQVTNSTNISREKKGAKLINKPTDVSVSAQQSHENNQSSLDQPKVTNQYTPVQTGGWLNYVKLFGKVFHLNRTPK